MSRPDAQYVEYRLSRNDPGQPPAYARKRTDGGVTLTRGSKSRYTLTREEAQQLAEIIGGIPPAKAQLVRYPAPKPPKGLIRLDPEATPHTPS